VHRRLSISRIDKKLANFGVTPVPRQIQNEDFTMAHEPIRLFLQGMGITSAHTQSTETVTANPKQTRTRNGAHKARIKNDTKYNRMA
jgi:hypothetical protein